MKTLITLLRGINVGGRNILPMKELIPLLENLGARSVKTYIQSGNAVFQHEGGDNFELSNKIRATIKENRGFEPQVLLLNLVDMEKAIASNPFPEAESEPKTVHLYFLATEATNPDLKTLENLQQNNEQFQLMGKVFYLYAPNGIGRSKLAAKVERALGVAVTARNWRSANKIMALAKGI